MDLPFVGTVTWTHVGLITNLVVLEGLLSFDNALALAALVKSRLKNPEDQKRALTWGIWGAYVFRIGIVFVGVWLMQFEWVKAVAGLYLVYLAVSELFFDKTTVEQDEAAIEARMNKSFLSKFKLSPLWQTIIAVELMDIMFSIDSVGVALAISDLPWVLVTGAVIGILMMRIAAQGFVKLIDRFPILEKTAFVLVGVAGLNVLLKIKDLPLGFTSLTIDRAIPEHPFLGLLMAILIGSLLLNWAFPGKFKAKHGHAAEL